MVGHVEDKDKGHMPSIYISSEYVGRGLASQGKRVSISTIISVMITLILGLYIFVELNFIIGFLMILLGAFMYYTRKRLERVG